MGFIIREAIPFWNWVHGWALPQLFEVFFLQNINVSNFWRLFFSGSAYTLYALTASGERG
jgi:hypothetical protein